MNCRRYNFYLKILFGMQPSVHRCYYPYREGSDGRRYLLGRPKRQSNKHIKNEEEPIVFLLLTGRKIVETNRSNSITASFIFRTRSERFEMKLAFRDGYFIRLIWAACNLSMHFFSPTCCCY